jgi:hypothetical protein
MVMAPSDGPAAQNPPDGTRRGPLFTLLAEVDELLVAVYGPEFEFELIGRAPGRRPIRLVCPRRHPPPAHPPGGETNADVILQVLSEADRPLTVVELAYHARGGEPTGAMRDALRKLVKSGRVHEIPGPPRQYESA